MNWIQTWESKSDFTVQIQKRKRIRKWPHHRDNSAVLRNESSGSCLRIISIRFSVHQCKNLHIFAILTFWVLLLQQPATRPASKKLQTAAAFISWSVVTAYAFVHPSFFLPLLYPCTLQSLVLSMQNRRVLNPQFQPAAWLRVGNSCFPGG